MADEKDIFDDDFLAPPDGDEEVLELDSAEAEEFDADVSELTELDETASEAEFDDFDLDVTDDASAELFEEAPAPVEEGSLDEKDQQTFGFQEPAADPNVSLGDDTVATPAAKGGAGLDDKKKKILLAVMLVLLLGAGGIAVLMMGGSSEPAPQPVVEEPVAAFPAAAEPAEDLQPEMGDTVPMDAEPEQMAAPEPMPEPEPEPAVEPEPYSAPEPAYVASSGSSAVGVVDVSLEQQGGTEVIRITLDGAPDGRIRSFALSDEPRYVVDFYGLTGISRPYTRSLEGQYAQQARLGIHEDRIRVVIDLQTDLLRVERSIEGDTLVLSVTK